MFVAVIYYAIVTAGQAIAANVDMGKLAEFHFSMLGPIAVASLWGLLHGALRGVPIGLQMALAVFFGREYIPPFISFTTRLTVRFVRAARAAWSGKPEPAPVPRDPAPDAEADTRSACTIMLVAILYTAAGSVSQVFSSVDLSKLADFHFAMFGPLFHAARWAAFFGGLQGVRAGLTTLLAVYFGREALPPFISWSTRLTVHFLKAVRVAWSGSIDGDQTDDTGGR